MTAETFELTPSSNAWPLLFKFRGPVLGTGFVALVEFTGRLLLRPHGGDVPDGFWIDGVNPGGFAFGACRLKDAHLELHSRLTGILADIAEEAESFDAFKSLVEEFFWQADDQTVGEWDSCVREAQSGRLAPIPGILPVMPATEPLGVRITLKPAEDLTPKDNSAPGPLLASVA
jgi:hypothetical protein